MLINLRNALMAGKRLPYDAEVEYLESSGTQYIDTGFMPTSNTSVEIGYKTADAQLNTVLFGRRVAYNNKSYCIWANANGKIRFDYALKTTNNADGPDYIAGSWADVSKRKERNYVNAIEYTANMATTFACDSNAYLFGMNDNGTANWLISAQISYCKIWDGDTLAIDFIPVRKKTVGYLYDRVSGKLFGNAGTGDFVLGPDVVPVEYIESHGTEWIDTGVPGRDGYDFEYRFRPISPLPLGIGGEYENNQSCYIGLVRSNGMLAYNYSNPNIIVEVQSLTLGTDYDIKAHLYSGEQYFEVNGVRGGVGRRTGAFTSSYNLYLFAINSANKPTNLGVMRLYNFTAHLNAIPTRSFRPVRVGTDATSWEGALIDTLTRRIYRNAGTGAFTYGNDLKYPIPAE